MGESGEFKTSGRQVTLFKQILKDDNTATKKSPRWNLGQNWNRMKFKL